MSKLIFFKFITVTCITQIFFTLLSNFYLSSRKNFKKTVQEMRELNSKLDHYNSQFALSQEQIQQLQYVQKQLEQASMTLSRVQMTTRVLMFIASFIVGKVVSSQFKFEMTFKAPFSLFPPLSLVMQRGADRGTDVLTFQGISFLVNQSIRKIISHFLAVKLPKAKMPVTGLSKKLAGDDAKQLQDMMSWFF
ncbi:Transmembrane domain-containing protein [Spironucleus salmonicida]|uniref:Transmembrane domain-containing protein n=1 Tax=Spironucleus salmonicida TaxID=348837 RepID=V6LP18_9EUKA|nr:Transmembrane domain-containing protein [Spironucleus salmonicida]|eukprot:EST46422.1 Transmembrane domain-containing protein [Spironucleus salmonicida]